MNIDQLKNSFQDPPSKFAFAPFWFLNHELTDDELKWQIKEMNANGVRGFVLHPRHGLQTEYLSEKWFARLTTCIEEADRLGMKVYLYDENNWPSGAVDGALIEEHPEYRMSGCKVAQRLSVAAGKVLKAKIEAPDGLIAVVAVPTEKNVLVGLPQSALLLDEHVHDQALEWEAPEDAAKWTVFVFERVILRSGTFFGGYLDTLNPDAVAKFIEMTHELYTERFAKYYGGTIDGMFTDEPSMCYFGPDTIPFTPNLPSEFSWRHGYEFFRVLPGVFADASEPTAQLRCDFYDTITHLYQQAFFKQTYDYCDPLHLNFIGHVMNDGELYESTRHQGDFFRGAEFMHWGGCDFLTDSLWPRPGVEGVLNNLIAPKVASSAAHIFGKERVMSEAYGLAGGWQIDMRALKCMTDWLVVLGVNCLQPHAFYYSIQGHRKWECPPGEFYQSPFWQYYGYLADYASRLCNVFAGARHVADVAVVYPSRSMWATITPDKTEESRKVVKGFETVTAALAKAGFDFDIIPEEILINETSSLDLEHYPSGETYKALVIPQVETLLDDTVDFIADCVEQGTVVILAGDPPKSTVTESGGEWSDGDWNTDIFMDLFCYAFDAEAHSLVSRGAEDLDHTSVVLSGATDMDENRLARVFSDVFDTFREAMNPDVMVVDTATSSRYIADIVHCHYTHGDNDFYMFVNTNRETPYSALISLDTIGVPSIWNAETGTVSAVGDYDYDGERTVFKLDFQPCESYVISVTTMPVGDEIAELGEEPKYSKIIELGQDWEFSPERPNALPLSEWKFSIGHYGYSAAHIYTTEFDCDADLTVARLAIDGLLTEKLWHGTQDINVDVTLNGEKVEGFVQGEYVDHLIKEADVLPLIKRGKNVLRIACATQLAPAGNLTDPAYIIGDFEISKKGSRYQIVPAAGSIKTGDWSAQGYPFYSGTGIYKQTVTLPRTSKPVFLRMDKPGNLAEILVNGEFAAVLPWEPWAADITGLVKAGENEITIKVANTMANVLMLESPPSGILGKVEIAIAK